MRRLYLATRSPRAGAPVLSWPAGAGGEVGDEGVFGFAGAVGDHLRPAGAAAQAHGFEGLGDGADLVDLDQGGVAGAALDGLANDGGVGDEDVVADELDTAAKSCREPDPAVPVGFGEAVFDAPHRKLGNDRLVAVDHVVSAEDFPGD